VSTMEARAAASDPEANAAGIARKARRERDCIGVSPLRAGFGLCMNSVWIEGKPQLKTVTGPRDAESAERAPAPQTPRRGEQNELLRGL
jgi:hypothetical protein